MAAAAAAQQYRNPTGGLQGPGNATATFLGKHQQQEQSRQLKSPSSNQQDALASVFSSSKLIAHSIAECRLFSTISPRFHSSANSIA